MMFFLASPAFWQPAAWATWALTVAATASAQEPAGAIKQMMVVPYDAETTEFLLLNPDQLDGPRISSLWDDPRTGASTLLFRFPRDYGGQPHTHSADYHLVVIEGSMKHWGKNQSEEAAQELGPGSY